VADDVEDSFFPESANKLALMKRFPASELAFVKSAKEFCYRLFS